MDLWSGNIADFVKYGESGAISGNMLHNFYNHHGYQPSESETRSWENSLAVLAQCVRKLQTKDIGVVLEYHLPYSGYRIDAMFFGKNISGRNATAIIELKQWSHIDLLDDDGLNVVVQNQEHVHPSQQALDYAEHIVEIQSAITEYSIDTYPCAFCHNLKNKDLLSNGRFCEIIQKSPLFGENDFPEFINYLNSVVGFGDGEKLMNLFTMGVFKPNKKLLDALDKVLNENKRWHLLDSQRLAYNAIWRKVVNTHRAGKKSPHSAILIRGGPGTGKSVIATQILADANRNNFTAVHCTGGKAFTLNLQAQFKGAKNLFKWNMNMRKAPTMGLDLLLVDEAHRVRYTSDTQYTPASERNKHSQMEELLDAAKVVVFLLDENQYVRPDEIGCTQLIIEETTKAGIDLSIYDLDVQFRCGGCTQYTQFVDYLLGFGGKRPEPWGNQYSFDSATQPQDLELFLNQSITNGETARIVAGFCWPWSDQNPDGSLINDVIIGDWRRPWNAKPQKKTYLPENHPYTIWAETPEGANQIGCIYSAQGFEFDRVGVIWGKDLVWRGDQWVAQREYSKDSPVKAKKADTERLLRNAYRVLLTRGIKGTRILCLDEETHKHIIDVLEAVQNGI